MTTETTRQTTTHRCTLPVFDIDGENRGVCTSPSCRRVWLLGEFGWRRTDEVQPLPEHPAPELPMRLAEPGEIPRTARAMAELAEQHGWTVEVTYARGTYGGRKPRLVESIAVRMRRPVDDRRAFGIWHDGRFVMGCRWTGPTWPTSCNATALREWVTS